MRTIIYVFGIVALQSLLTANTSAEQVLFRDDFDTEIASDWIPDNQDDYVGSVENGRFHWTPNRASVMNAALAGLPTDISIRTRVRLTGQPSGEVFLGVGGRDVIDFPGSETGSYYAGVTTQGRIGIGISSGPILLETTTDLDVVNNDVEFRFDMLGDQLKFWAWEAGTAMPDQPQVATTDETITAGDHVFLSYNATGNRMPIPAVQWDYFEVTAIPEPASGLLLTLGCLVTTMCLRLRRVPAINSSVLLIAIAVALTCIVGPASARITTYDFTTLTELSSEWVTQHSAMLDSEGLHLATPRSSSPAAGFARLGDPNSGWSIRAQGRLEQAHGLFGSFISDRATGFGNGELIVSTLSATSGNADEQNFIEGTFTSAAVPTDSDFFVART